MEDDRAVYLAQLKEKYPLVFKNIKFPVFYEPGSQEINDQKGNSIAVILTWEFEEPEKPQDQIGELISELLNGLK